ncbi:MAG: hypothetical protein PHZ17_03395 [Sulfurovum sp.]|nr:hypothetical protein [Sulfurovum sp.]
MRDILIKKGSKIRVDFNHSKFRGPAPDIQEVFVTSDDEPRMLSSRKFLLVGKTMKDYITIGTEQVVLNNYQSTLF